MRNFNLFLTINSITNYEEKKNYLLYFAGDQVQDVVAEIPEETLRAHPPAIADEYKLLVKALDDQFLPKHNVAIEQMVFQNLKQDSDEKFQKFILRLYQQAKKCGFGDQKDKFMRNQIVARCQSEKLRRDGLEKPETTLQYIINKGNALELVREQELLLKGSPKESAIDATVNRINIDKECSRCGSKSHDAKDSTCPAIERKCYKCENKGHFAHKCRSTNWKANSSRGGRGNGRSYGRGRGNGRNYFGKRQQSDDDNGPEAKKSRDEGFKTDRATGNNTVRQINEHEKDYVFCITSGQSKDAENVIGCLVGGVKLKMVIDSGSENNIIDQTSWEFLKSQNVTVKNMVKTSDKLLNSYTGHQLENIGTFEAEIQIATRITTAKFYVVNQHRANPLLGLATGKILGVIKIGLNAINNIDETRPLSKLKGVVIDLPIDEDIKPVIQPYRRVPVPVEDAVSKKLDELLAQGVIEPVKGAPTWISPMVVVPKENGQVRICIDMRRANQAIKRENHPLPVMEDFLPHLVGGKVFSKLDISSAYHQVEISEKSRHITTFITNKGLFRYTRLMFGISCAPEIFQKLVEQMLAGCEGCMNFIDDIVVYGTSKEQHDKRLNKVVETLRNWNVTLNMDKCVVGVDKIRFLGHELSQDGIRPTHDKVESVKQFRPPRNADELRSFLGLVNYVGRFIPDLATITYDLRILMRREEKFVWGGKQQIAFDELKSRLSSETVLGYFNVANRTQIIADASPVGLGAILIQICDGQPRIISYASKSLTLAEQRYCQTEKEALALVWAVEKFHFYIFGKEFDLISDHKPLEVIFGIKSKPCARIERWVMRLQSYQYKVIYKPGKSNIADPLSRLYVQPNIANIQPFDEEADRHINLIVEAARPVAMKLTTIDAESNADAEIQAVKAGLNSGKWDECTKLYRLFETELCFSGNILLRGTKIVIPKSLRNRTLELAHIGHPAATVMKRRIRAKVWWPKIDEEVEKLVKSCRDCLIVSKSDPPEPIKTKELPTEPWKDLAIDFMGPLPSGHYLFVVVDYYSRFIEVEIMHKIDAKETILRLKAIFARFGVPMSIRHDNGPQFDSAEFQNYLREWNIKSVSTIPYWPQMNGEVERQNRSLLKGLKISQEKGANWKMELLDYLLMYRSTKHSTTGKSPAELMFGGRVMRDKLPHWGMPMEIDEEVVERDKQKKGQGKVETRVVVCMKMRKQII